MGVPIYHYNWDFFKKPSEQLYYFLGFVAADGYINDEGIEIGLNEKDKGLLEQFRDWIVPGKPLYHKKATNSYTLKLSCRNKTEAFKAFYGMQTNEKCYELVFPQNIPEEFYKDFIRGYIDGDGTIGTTKGYRGNKVYIGPRLRILGNHHFLEGLNKKTKEFYKHNTNSIPKKNGGENIYEITYNFSTAKNLLKWLYEDCTICLERKRQRALEVTA